jgi:hypothetical protein
MTNLLRAGRARAPRPGGPGRPCRNCVFGVHPARPDPATATNVTSEAADLKSATVELHSTCQRALQPLQSAKWVKLHVQKQFVGPSTG